MQISQYVMVTRYPGVVEMNSFKPTIAHWFLEITIVHDAYMFFNP